jgi:uncharacterized membrane protein
MKKGKENYVIPKKKLYLGIIINSLLIAIATAVITSMVVETAQEAILKGNNMLDYKLSFIILMTVLFFVLSSICTLASFFSLPKKEK